MRAQRLPTELIKGNTKTLILAILRDGPSHGYGITHEIERRSESAVSFRQGSLYPLLHELEKDEMIVGQWETLGDERPKKIYVITEKGLAELATGLDAWRRLSKAIMQVTNEALYERR